MREYAALGHMVPFEGTDGDGDGVGEFIIPHHAVTMKFRVVFNGSAKSSNGVSLNDTQHVGPTVQDKLADILLRFRRYPVAVVADVEKMFRQIQINPEQQR